MGVPGVCFGQVVVFSGMLSRFINNLTSPLWFLAYEKQVGFLEGGQDEVTGKAPVKTMG